MSRVSDDDLLAIEHLPAEVGLANDIAKPIASELRSARKVLKESEPIAMWVANFSGHPSATIGAKEYITNLLAHLAQFPEEE